MRELLIEEERLRASASVLLPATKEVNDTYPYDTNNFDIIEYDG